MPDMALARNPCRLAAAGLLRDAVTPRKYDRSVDVLRGGRMAESNDRALELAVSEGIRALDDQRSSVESARSTATTAVGLSSIGTGFLATAALAGHRGVPWLGYVAIGLLLGALAATAVVLWPREWKWTNDPGVLASDEWTGRTPDDVHRFLAKWLRSHLDTNRPVIAVRWWAVRVAIVCSLLSIGSWTLLLGRNP
jgi:hypothetical protein